MISGAFLSGNADNSLQDCGKLNHLISLNQNTLRRSFLQEGSIYRILHQQSVVLYSLAWIELLRPYAAAAPGVYKLNRSYQKLKMVATETEEEQEWKEATKFYESEHLEIDYM